MSRDTGPVPERSPDPADPDDAVERRRRRARVFGEVLPESSRDERGEQWGERDRPGRDDDWFTHQVPPHHG
ncbi:MAG: hypothetical protein WB441_10445 [Nocardioidaceae bacterium]